MRVHVVSYLPRGERSSTRRLLAAALPVLPAATEVDQLELSTAGPDLFTPQRLWAYIRRNYLGEVLDAQEKDLMANMDDWTRRLVTADAVVLATPMHNFSFPAMVKAWFDAVMLKGQTWDVGEHGYLGLMKGKRALVLASSGGIYDGTDFAPYEHLVSLARAEFGFMGYDPVEHVFAQGMNLLADAKKESVLVQAEADAAAAAQRLADH